jgi:hypothetical protein
MKFIKTTLYTPIGKTEKDLKIESGVKQGCGLSPFLWVIYINPVLTKLEELKTNFRGAVNVSHITYINDITIVTESRKEMEMAIRRVETSLKKRGVKINTKKTVLTTKNHKPGKRITIGGRKVDTESGDKVTRFLGVWTNMKLDWKTQTDRIKKITKAETSKIKRMMLITRQRVTLVNSVLILAISYPLNFFQMNNPDIKEVDKAITQMIKQSARLATNIAACRLWMKGKNRGRGLTAASHINKVQLISNVVNNAWNSETKYPGELIKTSWIKKADSDDPAASPMEIIISEAI